MREKLAQRKAEFDKKDQALTKEYHQLDIDRKAMREQVKTELVMKFNDFENYTKKLTEVEQRESAFNQQNQKEKSELTTLKSNIEKERTEIDGQRQTLRAKEEKLVQVKTDHRSELSSLETRN